MCLNLYNMFTYKIILVTFASWDLSVISNWNNFALLKGSSILRREKYGRRVKRLKRPFKYRKLIKGPAGNQNQNKSFICWFNQHIFNVPNLILIWQYNVWITPSRSSWSIIQLTNLPRTYSCLSSWSTADTSLELERK